MATIEGTLGADTLTGTRGGDLITGHAPLEATATAPTFTSVATGLGQSLFATSAPGDAGHLHVVDKAGVIRVVDTTTGRVNATPFLDISAEVATVGEQGLLGLAFHPDYWANGKFYVFFSNAAGDTVLREYAVDPADPDTVLAGSGRDILTVPQPGSFTNHKGGWIGFGPDGMLSIATGDGGGAGDPTDTGQNPNDLLGSILRIDVNGDDFPGDPARNYAIPGDNPFADGIGGAREVWAYGLRNPYRDSFDRGTGDLWIGDVGQNAFEEVNVGVPGGNFGWDTSEGPTTAPGIIAPVFAYGHGGPNTQDRSVIGGYVARGPDTGLFGEYVFGDFISGRIWTLSDPDADADLDRAVVDGGAAFGLGRDGGLVSFAEDGDGTLYGLRIGGELIRIEGGVATGPLDGADRIAAGLGDDRVFAGAGNDTAAGGGGSDLVSGMEGDDRLTGNAGADLLIGGRGADVMDGGEDDDLLLGGLGDDRIIGGAGNDVLTGGAGKDMMTGGAGADRFRWTTVSDSARGSPSDRVSDFDGAAGDRLDLSALADGAFDVIGTAGFAATGAQVRVVAAGGFQRVEVSVDGGPADMVVLVTASASLTAGDFVL